jgi:hypothetical protein
MLQAYGPDVRFCEYAAVALLLQDGSSTRHDDGCGIQPAVWSGITTSCGPPRSHITTGPRLDSQKRSLPSTSRIPT